MGDAGLIRIAFGNSHPCGARSARPNRLCRFVEPLAAPVCFEHLRSGAYRSKPIGRREGLVGDAGLIRIAFGNSHPCGARSARPNRLRRFVEPLAAPVCFEHLRSGAYRSKPFGRREEIGGRCGFDSNCLRQFSPLRGALCASKSAAPICRTLVPSHQEGLVGDAGFEPATSTMSTWRSTPELIAQISSISIQKRALDRTSRTPCLKLTLRRALSTTLR